MWKQEIDRHLLGCIIPYWKRMKDEEFGGYYGMVDYNLNLYKKTVKNAVQNSRILWFFSQAYLITKDEECLTHATHAYQFLKNHFLDKQFGGIFWSVTFDGIPDDVVKSTFNMAYAILGLSTYYRASKDGEALELALDLQKIVENKCRDKYSYLEIFNREFYGLDDGRKKFSKGIYGGEKTMNTHLHLLEAYTELYRVNGDTKTAECIRRILSLFFEKIYNSNRKCLEVYFDQQMRSVSDYHSFGHDIEASWLLDRSCMLLGDENLVSQTRTLMSDLVAGVYQYAYDGHSIHDEYFNGTVVKKRVYWVQAEAVLGFYNAWQQNPEGHPEYLAASESIWRFIRDHIIDKRPNAEWLYDVDPQGVLVNKSAIVGPWKGPYNNGRMCMELLERQK